MFIGCILYSSAHEALTGLSGLCDHPGVLLLRRLRGLEQLSKVFREGIRKDISRARLKPVQDRVGHILRAGLSISISLDIADQLDNERNAFVSPEGKR